MRSLAKVLSAGQAIKGSARPVRIAGRGKNIRSNCTGDCPVCRNRIQPFI